MTSTPRAIALAPSITHARGEWWQQTITIRILELIYSCVLTLGRGSELSNPTSIEALLNDHNLDLAIWEAYRHLSQGGTSDCRPLQWRHDKRKILECLVSFHKQPFGTVDVGDLQRFGENQPSANDNAPWPISGHSDQRILLQAYHTPQTLSFEPSRAPSETHSTTSDLTVTTDPRRSESVSTAFSPAESSDSRGSRRRRPSSSMQTDKPGKRAKGPQEHACVVCHKTFPFLSKLSDHMKTHSTEKSLRCQYCKKSFKRTREVNAHLKSVHKIDALQIHPRAPPSPTATLQHPPTPASLPLPTTPAPFSMFPPTPGPTASLPPPRPSPRPLPYSGPGPYATPVPTPEQWNAPTPADADTEYASSAFKPRSAAVEDRRALEQRHRTTGLEEDVKPVLSDIIEATGRVDLSKDELPPIRNIPPDSEAPPAVAPGGEPPPSAKPGVDILPKPTTSPKPTPQRSRSETPDTISDPSDSGSPPRHSESPSPTDDGEVLKNVLFPTYT